MEVNGSCLPIEDAHAALPATAALDRANACRVLRRDPEGQRCIAERLSGEGL